MKEVVGDGVWKMERHTIELSTDELLLIARITGIMLGLAVPDKTAVRKRFPPRDPAVDAV